MNRIVLALVLTLPLLSQNCSFNIPAQRGEILYATSADSTQAFTQQIDIDDDHREAQSSPFPCVALHFEFALAGAADASPDNANIKPCLDIRPIYKRNSVFLI